MTPQGWIVAALLTALLAGPARASDRNDPVDAPQVDPPRQPAARVDPGPSEPGVRTPYIAQPDAPSAPRKGDIYGGPEAAADDAGAGLEYRGDAQPKAATPEGGRQPDQADQPAPADDADTLALPADGGVARDDPDILVRELGAASDGGRHSRAAEQTGIGQDDGAESGIELLPDSGLYLILPQDSRRPPVVIQTPGK